MASDKSKTRQGCEAISESLIIHTGATKSPRGVTITARCSGEIEVDGERYEFNTVRRFAAKKVKKADGE